jgi:hypothetical protein
MSIINGYSSPKVKLYEPAGTSEPAFTIELPLTNSGGLVEEYDVKKISHELISLDPEQPQITTAEKILGYIITFTLRYDQFITGEDLYNGVKKIFDAAKAGWKIMLTPRKDAPWREFEVILANSTLELGINKGGSRAQYHRLPVIIFKTKNLEPDMKWFPPAYSEPGGGNVLPVEGSN